MTTLKTRNHPCSSCESAAGGCKHRCRAYRDYEHMMHEKVYPARAEQTRQSRTEIKHGGYIDLRRNTGRLAEMMGAR